jgi:hypothetical protein
MSERVTGQASCTLCGWAAILTGDDLEDVRSSLRKIVASHAQRYHPTYQQPEPEPEPEPQR